MNLLAEFIKYLYEHIGDAYVWGAQGQKLSGMTEQNLIKWVRGHETSTVNADRALRFIANSTKNPLYAFDCSGLIMYFFQNLRVCQKTNPLKVCMQKVKRLAKAN